MPLWNLTSAGGSGGGGGEPSGAAGGDLAGSYPDPTVNSLRGGLVLASEAGLIQLGGTTSSHPAIKRNSATLEVRLADDSAYGAIVASSFQGRNSASLLKILVAPETPRIFISRDMSVQWSTGTGSSGATGVTLSRLSDGVLQIDGAAASDGLGTLKVGGLRLAISTKSGDYTAVASDHTLLVDSSGGPVTVTLPPAATVSGALFVVKKVSADADAVTIEPDGAETIDGAANKSTTTQWALFRVQSNGTDWFTV